MSLIRLALRGALYHWRTNVAVCLGVAAAVAALGGALVVGDSVRGSLRDLAVSRLGRTAHVVSSAGFFREALADDLARAAGTGAVPLIATTAFVSHEPSGRRASPVLVYGVDERFWRFHGVAPQEGVLVSPALAAELSLSAGDVLLARVQHPSEIPLESLFARKDNVARTLRLTVAGPLAPERLGEFSTRPQQGDVRAIFAPLPRLQRELDVAGRANTVLLAEGLSEPEAQRAFRSAVLLEDLGLTVEPAEDGSFVIVESAGGILSDAAQAAAGAAATALRAEAVPVFSYLANAIRIGPREVPYSLVAGVDLALLPKPASAAAGPGRPTSESIVLNEWAARELEARVGDAVEIEYYLWDGAAGLQTKTAAFTLTGIVPLEELAADRRLVPEYPGITEAENVAAWDPPFPLDLSRVRPQDEAYWKAHRTTPKAFVPYNRAAGLWSTRYGRLTSVRVPIRAPQSAPQIAEALRVRLRQELPPESQGLSLTPVRRLAIEASAGATNFGEYFTYFSFFIVVSALLLAVLFFRLGIEGRLRQIGILRAAGFTIAHVRLIFMSEAAALAAVGGAIGVGLAVAYAELIVFGLTTWWVGAAGTTRLAVHVTMSSLLAGFAAGAAAALACVWLSLRSVARRSPRALLGAYSLEGPSNGPMRGRAPGSRLAALAALGGFALLALGLFSERAQAGAFFGAGAAFLSSFLLLLFNWLRARDRRPITGSGPRAVFRLGFRGAAFRPGRSVLSAGLVASAAFIIVSVDAFRRGGGELTSDPRAGTGGYALLATSEAPLVHDPNSEAGREALLISAPALARARFARFRLRPGEDASCLNLYRPANPTIVAPESAFLERGRFSFAASLADTPEERANPWLLLRRRFDDGAVPAIADATSLQYVLHASVGDTMVLDTGGAPLTLRFVGALRDSVLQRELIIGEESFVRLFPGHEGFRFFLIEAPDVDTDTEAAALAAAVERDLQPFGVDAVSTTELLDAFHRVENTYLSTFQALGGLGLLLGTFGLGTVMFRNVLERRRELALLRAVGYDRRHVTLMILAETMLLLSSGLVAGAVCAALAIAPAWLGRGGHAPGAALPMLLVGVTLAGWLSAAAATRAALSRDVLHGLRSE